MGIMAMAQADSGMLLTSAGETYPVKLNGVQVFTVTAVFSPAYSVAGNYGSEVLSYAPSLLLAPAAGAALTRRHIVTIDAVQYQPIAAPVPTGTGLVTLQLQEVR